mgnify:CR=1 FL=1
MNNNGENMTPKEKISVENLHGEQFSGQKIKKIRRTKILMNAMISFVFAGIFIAGGIYASFAKRPEVSETERRKLMEKPNFSISSLFSGKFADDFAIYFSDTFPNRDDLVKFSISSAEYRGIRPDGIKIYSSDNGNDYAVPADQTNCVLAIKDVTRRFIRYGIDEKAVSEIKFKIELNKFEESQNKLIGEKVGSLFVVGNTAFEIFGGSDAASKSYADTVNLYRNLLPENVKLYSMLVPSHIEFGLPPKYSGVSKKQRGFMDKIFSNLSEGIIKVDPYDILEKKYVEGKYLYFRTDHHWTSLGAYYAYTEFCKDAGISPSPIEDYSKSEIYPFLGTFYSSTKDKKIGETPDTVEIYSLDFPYTMTKTDKNGRKLSGSLFAKVSGESNGYLTFLGGDYPLCEITTENKNSKSILIIKESYGNALVPFIVPNYEKTYVADMRHFSGNIISFIKENNIGEVLIVNNMFAANTSYRINDLKNLLYN